MTSSIEKTYKEYSECFNRELRLNDDFTRLTEKLQTKCINAASSILRDANNSINDNVKGNSLKYIDNLTMCLQSQTNVDGKKIKMDVTDDELDLINMAIYNSAGEAFDKLKAAYS